MCYNMGPLVRISWVPQRQQGHICLLDAHSLHVPSQSGWVRQGPTGAAAPCLVVFPDRAWSMWDYVCLPSFVVSVPNHLSTARLGVCLVAWTAPHAA
jgi:hypothetical protein